MLERAWEAGLGALVVIGESRDSAERALEIADGDARIRVTAGVHPHNASEWDAEGERWLTAILARPQIVALGEIGLDYHYDHSPRPAQRDVFERQLALAVRLAKPVIIHAREADADVAAVLRAQASVPVVLHSFSSGPTLLEAGLAIEAYFSFSGMITFRNWQLNDAIRAVPLDRILIETDSPYLAPIPHRGKRNEPAFVRRVAEQIALVRSLAVEDVIARTGENASRVVGLDSLA